MLKSKIILFNYHKPTKNGYPIKIRFTNGKTKKRKYVSTGYYAFENEFNDFPKPRHPLYGELMKDFVIWQEKLNTLIPEANRKQWTLDKVILKFKHKGDSFDFSPFIDTLNVKFRTKEAYHTAINSFKGFNSKIEKVDVYKWLNDLTISNNSKHVYIRSLKALFNHAIKMGYLEENPFQGISVPLTKTKSTALTTEDLIKIRDADFDGEFKKYRDYYMLLFYLGGILPIDLANLRYDKHLKNDRVEFIRFKGGTNELVSNKLLPQAKEILDRFDCKPYFVPIYQSKYKTVLRNFQRRFTDKCQELNLTKRAIPKSARSSFANRAKNLLVDRRICEDIMGHSRNDTHSIYEGEFTDEIRDEAHFKIISL